MPLDQITNVTSPFAVYEFIFADLSSVPWGRTWDLKKKNVYVLSITKLWRMPID